MPVDALVIVIVIVTVAVYGRTDVRTDGQHYSVPCRPFAATVTLIRAVPQKMIDFPAFYKSS